MSDLVYYTVGYNRKYIDILSLSIESLRKSGYDGDVLVICDESFLNECKEKLGDNRILYNPVSDANTPEQASMNKLRIFEYEGIGSYERLLFLDSDILVHMDVRTLFTRVTNPNVLYVYTESTDQKNHTNLMWSLETYTADDLETFNTKNIYVFNAGCFALVRNQTMKDHFLQVQYIMSQHAGRFFYEQSFMNVYFNQNNQTDRTLLTDENYIFFPKNDRPHPHCLLHFAGDPGNGDSKLDRMTYYMKHYLSSCIAKETQPSSAFA